MSLLLKILMSFGFVLKKKNWKRFYKNYWILFINLICFNAIYKYNLPVTAHCAILLYVIVEEDFLISWLEQEHVDQINFFIL